jgi:transposase
MARKTLRRKITQLEEALTGYFTGHHAFLLRQMLARVDAMSADITALDAKIEEVIAPFADAAARLDEIPGINRAAAHAIRAEIGPGMSRFPTAGHLASWAKYAPGVKESAGKKKGKSSTGHGSAYLARILGNAAAAAGRTDALLGERYRRIARRRGSTRANVAIGRSILVIIWHLLSDPEARFIDLGPDFYATRTDPDRRMRNHVRQLQALGYTVTLEPTV